MEKVLILDFGSQVTQLIARRLRDSGVYCEIWPFNTDPIKIYYWLPSAIILSGGPASVHQVDAPAVPQAVFDLGVPVLGICYGQQTMCQHLGGRVVASDHREFGPAFVEVVDTCPLFEGVWEPHSRQKVWMSHGDRVTMLPLGFRTVATSDGAPFAAIAYDKKKLYGVQFHPEVTHTPAGAALLRNFTHNICRLSGTWNMADFRSTQIEKIHKHVGTGNVICGLSGGVDSAVAAVLIHEAIGDQLTCIFVDHGLLRQNEADDVVSTFRDRFNINLIHVNAANKFLSALDDVSDPEQKRKIIGKLFVETFEEEATKLGGADYLAQGTLYPDVIESVSFTGGPSVTIKSHHNVGGLPERMRMKLVEPLRELFKDEVRNLGRELGIPENIVGRHPFPGPGLAIRIPGIVTKEKADLLRMADAIYLEEIRNAGLYNEIWQAFAILIDDMVILRAVTSVDGMTADVYPFSDEFLQTVRNRIVAETGVTSVGYDQTNKPPGTIEWE